MFLSKSVSFKYHSNISLDLHQVSHNGAVVCRGSDVVFDGDLAKFAFKIVKSAVWSVKVAFEGASGMQRGYIEGGRDKRSEKAASEEGRETSHFPPSRDCKTRQIGLPPALSRNVPLLYPTVVALIFLHFLRPPSGNRP